MFLYIHLKIILLSFFCPLHFTEKGKKKKQLKIKPRILKIAGSPVLNTVPGT